MKIVIELMLNAGDMCDMDITDIKNTILEQIERGISYHMHDHIHSIEVLVD